MQAMLFGSVPFVLLFWLFPFVADTTIGRDYSIYAIETQIELLFYLKTGSFPLFVPGYFIGQTASAVPLAQFFHPISHIASLLPGY